MTEISLTEYDTVVAVTQDAINLALAEWFEEQEKQVALYYSANAEGEYVPSTKDEAQFLFEGTLAPATGPDGKPIDLVTLHSPKGSQTVQYNVTFSGASFECKPLKFVATEQPGSPWVMRFDVDLKLEPAALEKLPQKVQEEIKNGIEDFDEDTFSIQRLWADLTTAALSSFEGIEGMPQLAEDVLEGVMQRYLAEQQEKAEMIFGCGALHTGPPAAAPTFAPTALDFCVTPYEGPQGEKKPELDTLNYLVMTESRPLPESPPKGFPFNWVEDPSVAGRVAIRGRLFAGYLLEQLAPILPQISPAVVCDAKAHGDHGEIRSSPSNSTSLAFTAVEPSAASGTIGTYSYNPGIKPSTSYFSGGASSVEAHYSASAQVIAAQNLKGEGDPTKLLVSGQIRFSGSIESQVLELSTEESLPPTTWSWEAELQLAADLTTGGQLDLTVLAKDFSSPPTVEKHDPSWWERFFERFAVQFQKTVQDFGGIRAEIEATSLPAILASIEKAGAGPHHFVFPGAKTFLYADPCFGAGACLVANVAYQGE